MKRFYLGSIAILILSVVVGCGGGGTGSQFKGEVSGVITDVNGSPVRGAKVFSNSRETTSNSAGIYVLSGVPEGNHTIRAEVSRDGLKWVGQNVVAIFRGERSKSLNIALVRNDQTATLHGKVRDSSGHVVQGARVFAYGNALSSAIAITDADGDYRIEKLASGVTYLLTASARTYDNDLGQATMSPGELKRFDFTVKDSTNPVMPAPENLVAVAWTSPKEITRDSEVNRTYEYIKRMIDPRRGNRPASGRDTILGNNVEVDLYWDPLPGSYDDNLLGFGIYRATTSGGVSTAVDFLRDPITIFYSDVSAELIEGRNYYYEITSLGTNFPDTFNSESNFSNRYGVHTLGDMVLRSPLFGPLTFRWDACLDAEEYKVFLFDKYPSIGISSIWNTNSTPTAGLSQVYTGPSLQAGKTYYYIVLAEANGGDSKSLSAIGSFVAN
ncbi:MAG: carboxypeptidase regulatory-like domain-containing protein [Fimbriimonadaceae bacterium]|nr:carboxypeptidase regulatory-like domain-containing protein [Fimbriimonadaceae bacterium]